MSKDFYYTEITKTETSRTPTTKKYYITICITQRGTGSGSDISALRNEIATKIITSVEVLHGHKIDADVN